jgi:thymidylate synthase ThyX
METQATVVACTRNPYNDKVLTTLELTYPYIIHAQVMTHRIFSRNAASLRAQPTSKVIEFVRQLPYIPDAFPKTASPDTGMQPDGYWPSTSPAHDQALAAWCLGLDKAVETAEALVQAGVHKQIASRPLIPYMYQRTLVSSTEWDNWDTLRLAPDAQREVRVLATAIKLARDAAQPVTDTEHVPYVTDEEFDHPDRYYISAGRCARLSYNSLKRRVKTPEQDAELGRRLLRSKHMSPFEHIGIVDEDMFATDWSRNFQGWVQWRSVVDNEV